MTRQKQNKMKLNLSSILAYPFCRPLALIFKTLPSLHYHFLAKYLRKESSAVLNQINAYQHIENACDMFQQSFGSAKGWTVVDVGGGIGNTAKIFDQRLSPESLFIVEPIPENISKLKAISKCHWMIHEGAAGNTPSTMSLHLAERITASSLLELNSTDSEYGNILKSSGSINVSVSPIDTLIPSDARVAVLKMDVQGFELAVLEGAADTLKRTSLVVLEVNNHRGFRNAPEYYELDEFLRAQGFELIDILAQNRQNGRLLDWDSIYMNRNLHVSS
jgi:FkbM family methyltransferase